MDDAKALRTVSFLLSLGERYLKERDFEKPRREAEELLFTLLYLTRIDLYLHSDRVVSEDDKASFINRIFRRGRHEPLQYITGQVDFCGQTFCVSPGVFIPRPETELMVEAAIALSPAPQSILDLCTGSGVLAISLAKAFPNAEITAIDCSQIVLNTARLNQKRLLETPKIAFLKGDLFAPLTTPRDLYDLIVCNPPYIAEEGRDDACERDDTCNGERIDPDVLKYEPSLALFSPDNGTAHIKKILLHAPPFLSQNGTLMLEIGMGQSGKLLAFIQHNTQFTASVIKDYAGIDRIIICQWTK